MNCFEGIKHIDEKNEYWFARELQKIWDTKDGVVLLL